jgi:hypothetical protein
MDLVIILICVYVLYLRGFLREPMKFKQILLRLNWLKKLESALLI